MPAAQNRLSIGGNFPPSPIELDPVKDLKDRLARDYAPLAKDFINLELGLGNVPAKIETEEQAKDVSDCVAQCKALIKEGDKKHKIEAEPHLKLKQAVDDFFLRRKDRLLEALGVVGPRQPPKPGSILDRLTAYHQAKQKAERERQEAARRAAAVAVQKAAEEARQAREEAERIKATDREAAVALRWKAHAKDDAAKAAAAIVAAPPVKAQIRGLLGSVTYGKTEWDYEVESPGEIPMVYLIDNRPQILAAINKQGVRDIPGIRIYERPSIVTKGS